MWKLDSNLSLFDFKFHISLSKPSASYTSKEVPVQQQQVLRGEEALLSQAKDGFFQLSPTVQSGSPGHCGVSGSSSSSPGGLGATLGLPSLPQDLETASCFLWEKPASWRSLSERRPGLDGKLKSHWITF